MLSEDDARDDTGVGEDGSQPELTSFDINLRTAIEADSRKVWQWRNDPETRAMSLDKNPVAWEVHRLWFADSLSNSERHLLMAELDGHSIGVLRLDRLEPGLWEMSINLAPPARGRGLSTSVLEAGLSWLRGKESRCAILARVKEGNERSLRAFRRAGYREISREEGLVTLTLGEESDPD